jgi:hypothetical protein
MNLLKDIQKELAEFQNKAFAECCAEQMIAENIYNIAVYSHCCLRFEVIKERLLDKLFFSLPKEKQCEMLNEIMSEIKTERATNKTTHN